jgi:hypothetical protein
MELSNIFRKIGNPAMTAGGVADSLDHPLSKDLEGWREETNDARAAKGGVGDATTGKENALIVYN